MKIYKIELLIIDFDEIGPEEIKIVLETQRFPNRCLTPHVMDIAVRDIGEWLDDNPLNFSNQQKAEYQRLFKEASG